MAQISQPHSTGNVAFTEASRLIFLAPFWWYMPVYTTAPLESSLPITTTYAHACKLFFESRLGHYREGGFSVLKYTLLSVCYLMKYIFLPRNDLCGNKASLWDPRRWVAVPVQLPVRLFDHLLLESLIFEFLGHIVIAQVFSIGGCNRSIC